MRLSARERTSIKTAIRRADKQAKIYLFGSRTNDTLRGGDIDLLVISERLAVTDRIDILAQLKDAIGEQKIDILIKTAEECRRDPFVKHIRQSAVLL